MGAFRDLTGQRFGRLTVVEIHSATTIIDVVVDIIDVIVE